MSNLNAPIKNSKNNLSSVKAAVQSVHAQHSQVVNALAGVILGVISVGMITVGQAAAKVESALKKALPAVIQMLSQLSGLGNFRVTIQKILLKLALP
jgi:Flp pilus assembly pilin Flp